MANLTSALQQLRAEQREAQLHVEKLGQAISVIESLNGTGTSRKTNQPKRFISAASRRKMAQAQRARWAKVRKGPHPAARALTGSAPTKRTMSAAARRRISLAQKKRWARSRGQRPKSALKPKRTMSAAGKKRIAAAARARWAKFRAAKKKAA